VGVMTGKKEHDYIESTKVLHSENAIIVLDIICINLIFLEATKGLIC
jgi:hypothetical protein